MTAPLDYKCHLASLEKRAAADRQLQPALDEARFFLEQKQNARLVLPTVTYTDRLELTHGERTIHVLHHDRAVTPGDTSSTGGKILIAGDLLVNPVPFALSSYPTGWLRSLSLDLPWGQVCAVLAPAEAKET